MLVLRKIFVFRPIKRFLLGLLIRGPWFKSKRGSENSHLTVNQSRRVEIGSSQTVNVKKRRPVAEM